MLPHELEMQAGSRVMSAELPFTKFRGQIKQIETDFRFPIMRRFYETCFSEFDDIDRLFANLKQQGIHTMVSAGGVQTNYGYRPRRFAGGPGLPPGRYFTLCDGLHFNDGGTLRDEITAYYSGASGITATIFDSIVDAYIKEDLKKSGNSTDEDLRYPFYLIIYQIERRTDENAALLEMEQDFTVGHGPAITYGVRQLSAEIDSVVDLRYPATQDWFFETFVHLELENENRAAQTTNMRFPAKRPLQSFQELLPAIVSLETGGGMVFGQAVGQWLRRHGANGLIFPSARSNSFNRVASEKPVEWGGWNLVVYSEAEEPVKEDLFGRMTTWRDPDHDHIWVDYTAAGAERGSFSIRGVREFNLLNFDLKRQVACGLRNVNVAAEITGTKNASLSRMVNLILEKERDSGSLWYRDVDYLDFIRWHENQWRDRVEKPR